MALWVTVVPLLLCVPFNVLARPSRTIPYFPQYNPWDLGDIGIHAEENRWQNYHYPDDTISKVSKYLFPFDANDNPLRDRSTSSEDFERSVPVYEKGKGGFVPSSMSALDKVYWWDKRFNHFDIPPSEDLQYFADDGDYESGIQAGSVKKRDYTAAQLVNMLKALAKARRQREIRIAGKGLRFGISR